ncbi:MAG: 3-isopropylmalate/(R)-2-methylmalate dehydratase small subunit [Porticoccaceae bacterium]|jgi:3-isopropylmalate/(R)-2-methylmalate dehydratase small subunit|tara:strand:+ start:105 stop:728 length:624 start_codon:yes stop_codon:yes gene_type:complete
MRKFLTHRGVAAALLKTNIDTDTIIPSREIKRVSKQGLREGLFAAWRYSLPGSREINHDFILNKAQYQNTSIILSGDNFGCGSSREHAVWALKEYGIRSIVAPSFGSIFHSNCVRNGILPITLPDISIRQMATFIEQDPQCHCLNIDLASQSIQTDDGQCFYFELDKAQKDMLLNGLDSITLTQTLNDTINNFEQQDKVRRPWIYLR